jgi:hypothetical protein
MRVASHLFWVSTLVGVIVSGSVPRSTAAEGALPVTLTGLKFEQGPSADAGPLVLRGRDSRRQLLVTGAAADGRLLDVTRTVQFSSEPVGIVEIDQSGYLTPLQDGAVTVKAVGPDGLSTEVAVAVSGISQDVPVNFPNQVVPIFTKLACNSGGCHGKASGQNGFKLSLLGFYPEDDHEFLVKEARGRRLFPTAAGQSLLLTKAVGQSPHGGGKRMEANSFEYRLLSRWIEQGMPYGEATDPTVVSIRCVPAGRIMGRGGEQQVSVLAVYSDGSTEDVTRMALFEANETEMAEVSVTGLVKTHELAGEVAIMARYQGQVSTFRATVPLGMQLAEKPPVKNFIDEAVLNKLSVLGIPPSPLADDATFLRRVTVDITGRLPTEAEVSAFLADSSPDKRDRWIDQLIDSPEYADYFANKWNMVLRNRQRGNDRRETTFGFHQWIWSSLYENKPYDQFVREILTASGSADENPPVVWYREVDQANEQVEDVAQLFLGVRIQCARCHHHPFEKWSQDDYYGLAAFFSRVGRKNELAMNGQLRDKRIFHQDAQGPAAARNERSGKMLPPAGLGATPLTLTADDDPRLKLVDWMSDRQNPFFARALVNRYWKHFFSRGIVEPEDDMRETNPPSNPELLQGLAQHFVDTGFDLKQLVRTICQSSTYQLSSLPNEYNLKDKQNFSRYYPKRLTAEVLYDAFHQVTGTQAGLGGLPQGSRSMQIPDPSMAQNVYFLKVFGQPQGDTACECERSQEANLAQSLHLLNSSEVQNKIAAGDARPAVLAAQKELDNAVKVQQLYRWMYSRNPDADELQTALNHLAKHVDNPKLAFEDITWALINTKEFLFNH